MFPWQGEGKSSVMGKAPADDPQRQQQQKESSNSSNTGLRWRAPSFFQRNNNRPKETVSSGMQQKTSNMSTEVVDVDDDDNNHNNNNTTPDVDTPMSDVPGDEQASSGSRASQTDGDEERDDEDEDGDVSEGGDIQHTVTQDKPRSTSADDGNTNSNNDNNDKDNDNPTNGTSASSSSLPVPPGSSQHHVILDANRAYYGKRLNFKEQVLLFEICNKYKSTFGERSKLCEWWRNVTEEFCREINGPYSWHSVRRKVEQVTKQRVKQRSEEENSTTKEQYPDDLCKVVDEFIPVWTKFEASEKRRIEVRDSRAASAKKRKVGPIEAAAATRTAPVTQLATPPGVVPWHVSAQRWTPVASPIPPPQFYTPPGVKMPAGYDTMFKPPHNGPQTPQSAAPGPYPPHALRPPPLPQMPPSSAPPSQQQRPLSGVVESAASDGSNSESMVTTAVLQTLSSLNKYLEQVASASTDTTSNSPIAASLAGGVRKPSESPMTTAVLEILSKLNKSLGKTPAEGADSSPLAAAFVNALNDTLAKASSEHNNNNNNNTSEETTATEKSPAAEQLADETTNAAQFPRSPSNGINTSTTTSTTTTSSQQLTASQLSALKKEFKEEMQRDFVAELQKIRDSFSERLDSMEQTQEMIMDMLRQEPGRDNSQESA